MGFFDSKSSTNQIAKTATQSGSGQGDVGTGLNLAGLDIGAGKKSNVDFDLNVETTDFGSVSSAIDFAENTTNNALLFAGQGASKIIDIATGVGNDALVFAGEAVTSGQNFASNVVEQNARTTKDVLQLAGGATLLAVNASESARVDALEFAGGSLDFVGDFAGQAINASENARRDGLQFAGEATNFVGDFAELAIGSSEAARVDALEFGAGAFNTALDFVGDDATANRDFLGNEQNRNREFLAGAVTAIQSSANNVAETQKQFALLTAQQAENTSRAIQNAATNSLTFAGEAVSAAQSAFAGGLSTVRDFTDNTLAGIANFSDAAISRFVSASASDSEKNREDLLSFGKAALVAVGVIVAVTSFNRK